MGLFKVEPWREAQGHSGSTHTVTLTAVVADVAQRSARLQEHLLVGGVEELDEWRDEAGFHARGPHELWRREGEVNTRSRVWASTAPTRTPARLSKSI